MFGVEPQEQWTEEQQANFEEHAAARLKVSKSSAAKAGASPLINIAIIVPFSAGHQLHSHWQQARSLVLTAELLFLWFLIKVAYILIHGRVLAKLGARTKSPARSIGKLTTYAVPNIAL
jgi:hypothetical protein